MMNLYQNVNQLFENNKDAKNQIERTKVIENNSKLLLAIQKATAKRDEANSNGSDPDNPYSKLMNEISNWITNGKSNYAKDYKAKLKNENPSEIKDNKATNNRIYHSESNYYKDRVVQPTKAELKVPYIKDIYKNLIELKHQKHGNHFKISEAIRQTKDDLKLAIINHRGIDEFNRTDNTPTPDDSVHTPSLHNKAYEKYLITTSLHEIHDENVRLDKMIINKRIKYNSLIFHDLEKGYTYRETAKRNGTSKSTVARMVNNVIN